MVEKHIKLANAHLTMHGCYPQKNVLLDLYVRFKFIMLFTIVF